MPRRAGLVVFLSIVGAIFMVTGISAGAAQEDRQSKKANVKSAQERLMQARMDQSAAYESYNSALGELNQLDGEIAETEKALQDAEEQFARAQKELEDRASQVYKSGNVAFMDVLVGVDEFSDFATRVDLWMELLEEERIEFDNVRQARDELEARKNKLETQRAQRAETVKSAIDRKEQAENAEADAQAYLDSLSGELRSLIQADQARRAAEARANAEKLREKFAAQASSEAPEPAPVQAERPEEPPEQRLSLQAQKPAPEPAPAPQQPEKAQKPAPAPESQPEETQKPSPEPQALQEAPAPQPDPELLAQQEEAERLAAERRAAAEKARAEQAEAERQAKLAAEQAEAQQEAAEQREAQERAAARAAAAKAAQRRAEQAAVEQAAAELAAQQAAERRAQRQAEIEAQRQAELEAQRQAELEAQRQAELEAQRQADLEAQRQADLEAQRQAELEAQQQAELEAETTTPIESAPAPAEESAPAEETAPPTGPAPPAPASGNAVVAEVANYMGTPYVLGGWESCVPYEMMDCSCLTATVYQAFGFSLPDSPGGQMGYGTPVSGPPAAGDLVFWSEDGSGYITHVGIATGNGTVIHASAYEGFVTETAIEYIPGYVGATRLL